MKATGKKMPIKRTKADLKAVTKGTVVTPQRPAPPAGFPAQQSVAYRGSKPQKNLPKSGLQPRPVRKKK